jgi:hypothetical protein
MSGGPFLQATGLQATGLQATGLQATGLLTRARRDHLR